MTRWLPVLMLAALPQWADGQLTLRQDSEPMSVFCGGAKTISTTWHCAGEKPFSIDARLRLLLASASTAAPVAETPWKRLEILPGQTVLETAQANFPEVRAATPFVIQWIGESNQVLGASQLTVYPANLLAELAPLAAGTPIGLFDPQNALKPLLKSVKQEYVDLEESNFENFTGRLAIAGPFTNRTQLRKNLGLQIEALVKRGVGAVWLLPPMDRDETRREPIAPSFYSLPQNGVALVVAQAFLTRDLADNPQAQLHLIQFAKLALHPEPPRIPFTEP